MTKRHFREFRKKLSGRIKRSHEHVYGSKLIKCKHCGHWVTGEPATNRFGKKYVYYRCTRNTKIEGHPPTRLPERKLDQQFLELFEQMRITDATAQDWFGRLLRERVRDRQDHEQKKRADLQTQLTKAQQRKDQLLNLRLNEEINPETYAEKAEELRDREAYLREQIDVAGRNQDDFAEITIKAFELSQNIADKWFKADYAAKRRALEIVCLNLELDGVNLVATMRKPFDVIAKGLDLAGSTP